MIFPMAWSLPIGFDVQKFIIFLIELDIPQNELR